MLYVMKKILTGLALALSVFGAYGQQTDCVDHIRQRVEESKSVFPMDIAGVATLNSMDWNAETSTFSFTMTMNFSLNGSEGGQRVREMRPKLLPVFINMPEMADMLRCVADLDGHFELNLFDADGGVFPKYTLGYNKKDIYEALDSKPTTREEYNERFLQGYLESASIGLPMKVEEDIDLEKVYSEDSFVVYDYRVTDTPNGSDLMQILASFPQQSRLAIASDIIEGGDAPMLLPLAEKGYGLRYRYRLQGSETVADVDFTPEYLESLILRGLN